MKKSTKKGRKGIDASHLLNIRYESHAVEEEPVYHSKPRRSKGPIYSSFKQSIFRLTVAPVKGFINEKCFWDMDTSVPWNMVVLATVLKSEIESQCPICLDNLQVPRITECGHLFCCDTSGPRCPVCAKYVCQPDLRCVRICESLPVLEIQTCCMSLCRLGPTRIYPELLSSGDSSANSFEDVTGSIVPFFSSPHSKLSRVSVGSIADIRSIFVEERVALLSYQSDCAQLGDYQDVYFDVRGDVEHLPYIEIALQHSTDQENSFVTQVHQCLQTIGSIPFSNRINRSTNTNSQSDEASCPADTVQSTSSRNTAIPFADNNTYYYQFENGQNIFLHPLCVRILLAQADEVATVGNRVGSDIVAEELNSSASCVQLSNVVSGIVIETERLKVTSDIRQRVPFVRHLSLGTDIVFVEIDMKQLVSPQLLSRFKDELHAREKRRKHKQQLKKREKEQDEEDRQAHEIYVQMIRSQQQKEMEDLEHALLSAPPLSAAAGANDAVPVEDGSLAASAVASAEAAADSFVRVAVESDNTKSFARITQMSGYFPSMGSSSSSNNNGSLSRQATPQPQLAWGNSSGGSSASSGIGQRKASPAASVGVGSSSAWASTVTTKASSSSTAVADDCDGAEDDEDDHMEERIDQRRQAHVGSAGAGPNKNKKKNKKGTPLFTIGGARSYRS